MPTLTKAGWKRVDGVWTMRVGRLDLRVWYDSYWQVWDFQVGKPRNIGRRRGFRISCRDAMIAARQGAEAPR